MAVAKLRIFCFSISHENALNVGSNKAIYQPGSSGDVSVDSYLGVVNITEPYYCKFKSRCY